MGRIANMLMLSCKKATSLIEKKSLIGLSVKENLQLKIHNRMCVVCLYYKKQSLIIDDLLHELIYNSESAPLIKNEALKEKIIKNLH